MNREQEKEGKRKGEIGKRKKIMKEKGERVPGVWYLGNMLSCIGIHFSSGFYSVVTSPHCSKFSLTTVYSCLTAAYLWIFKGLTHNGRGNHSSPSQGKMMVLVCYPWHISGLEKRVPCSYMKKLEVYWDCVSSIAAFDLSLPPQKKNASISHNELNIIFSNLVALLKR